MAEMYASLAAEDFRSVFHLLGECGELWIDPAAWQNHLLAGISRLIHLPVGLHAELNHFISSRPVEVIAGREHGWPDAAAQAYFAVPYAETVLSSLTVRRAFSQISFKHGDLTVTRADLVNDSEWHRSEAFNLAHRPVQMDEMIYSAVRTGPPGRVHLIGFGGAGHYPAKRDRELLQFLHREFILSFRSRLTSDSDYSLSGLSPRRREILNLVATGLPEKQIADRLALRPSSVNEQIQEIYAHFCVHTRASSWPTCLNVRLCRDPELMGIIVRLIANRPSATKEGGAFQSVLYVGGLGTAAPLDLSS